jgi:hypothetical protein
LEVFITNRTRDYGCIIIDQAPQLQGPKKYYHYKAKLELPKFTMLCDAAWGGPRHFLCDQQRRTHKQVQKYTKGYLERMFPEGKMKREEFEGQTDQFHRATEYDIMKMVAN